MEIKDAFKYCSRCGTEGVGKDGKLHCPNCGLDTYFNPKPVQEVALRDQQGRYLFCVRAVEPQKGKLDFPGGFVEAGETFEESARRELKEELGIEVGELQYVRSSIDSYLFQGISYQVVGVSYYGELPPDAKIKPADDVESVEFFSLDKVPSERVAWPAMHELLDMLQKQD